jgi:ribonuclease BN (tRNA processing enzyme)
MGLSVTVLGCSGSYPGPGLASSGYLVQSETTNVWLDTGPGTFSALQQVIDPRDLTAIVLSHSHVDHWIDLATAYTALRYFLEMQDIPVYGTAETRKLATPLVSKAGERTFVWTTIDQATKVMIGDLAFSFARTAHPVETLAVRVDHGGRSLAYSADTGVGWSMGTLGDGIDLAFVEASLATDMEDTFEHLSGRQAGAMARDAGVARLVITHIIPGVDVEMQRRDAEAAYGATVEVAAPLVRYDA